MGAKKLPTIEEKLHNYIKLWEEVYAQDKCGLIWYSLKIKIKEFVK